MIKTCMIAAAASLLALLILQPAQGKAKPQAQFLWLSDVHFDPTADPKLVDALAQANIEDWPRILSSSPAGKLSTYGEDTNWELLSSSFSAIRKIAPENQFVVVTGDLLVHHFYDKFQSAAKDHDEQSFQRFARKTMQFISLQIAKQFPGKPVFLTLGNDDSECGNYQVEPQGPFLKDSGAWIPNLLGPLADAAVQADWAALGSYSVPNPSLQNVRVISVNSVYFSPRYRNACAPGHADPANQQMHWLESKLAEAERNKQRVWLIFHIPPGIDGFASSHGTGAGTDASVVPMWKPTYTEQFQKLLEQYRKTVIISLAGHEHTDDFRLIGHSLVLLTPAISPVVGQNPAFRTVTFLPDGTLSDEVTYYLSNLDKLSREAAPEWKPEYDFDEAWQLHQLNFQSFRKLHREIERQSAARDRWSAFYSVSHPQAKMITPQTFPPLFCVTDNPTEAAFNSCVKRLRGAKK